MDNIMFATNPGWFTTCERIGDVQGFAHLHIFANEAMRKAGYRWLADVYHPMPGYRYRVSLAAYTDEGAWSVNGIERQPLDLDKRLHRKPRVLTHLLRPGCCYVTKRRLFGYVHPLDTFTSDLHPAYPYRVTMYYPHIQSVMSYNCDGRGMPEFPDTNRQPLISRARAVPRAIQRRIQA